jgi:hypothetical protein
MRASVWCSKKMCCFHEKLLKFVSLAAGCLLQLGAEVCPWRKNWRHFYILEHCGYFAVFGCYCSSVLYVFLVLFWLRKATSRITDEAKWFNIKCWIYWRSLQVTCFFFLIITVLVSGAGFPFHWFYRFRLQCFHWLRRMHLRCVAVCMISIFFLCLCLYVRSCACKFLNFFGYLIFAWLHITSSCFLLYSGYFGNKLKLLMILFSSYTFPGICMTAKFLHTLNLFLLRNFI